MMNCNEDVRSEQHAMNSSGVCTDLAIQACLWTLSAVTFLFFLLNWCLRLLLQLKRQFRNRRLKSEAEAFAHYRQTHTANERRRRNEMRDLFEKLKKALGLNNLPKVSKSYILKQVSILKWGEESFNLDRRTKIVGTFQVSPSDTARRDILSPLWDSLKQCLQGSAFLQAYSWWHMHVSPCCILCGCNHGRLHPNSAVVYCVHLAVSKSIESLICTNAGGGSILLSFQCSISIKY